MVTIKVTNSNVSLIVTDSNVTIKITDSTALRTVTDSNVTIKVTYCNVSLILSNEKSHTAKYNSNKIVNVRYSGAYMLAVSIYVTDIFNWVNRNLNMMNIIKFH